MDTRMMSALAMAVGMTGLVGSRPRFEGGASPEPGPAPEPAPAPEPGPSPEPAPSLEPGPSPSGVARPEGGYGNFLDNLSDEQLALVPPEFVGSAHLEGLTDLPTAVKVLHDRGAALSKKGVRVPTQSDPPEAWDKFYSDLGRPKEPGGYAVRTGGESGIPEGFALPKEDLEAVQGVLHKAGLSEAQGSAVLTAYAQALAQSQSGLQQQLEQRNREARAVLTRQWGEHTQEHLDELTEFIRQSEGGDELLAELDGNGLGLSPRLLMTMHDLVKKSGALAEAGLAMTSPSGHRLSAKDMEAELQQLTGDPESAAALQDSSHPRHKAVLSRFDALTTALARSDDAARTASAVL
ncbi:MAG: hypothetical protein ACNA8P_12465 [Phycisphaerales bacterium]